MESKHGNHIMCSRISSFVFLAESSSSVCSPPIADIAAKIITSYMRRALLAACAVTLLSGCDLLDWMLPHKPTTATAAQRALQNCGMTGVSWRVDDGALILGKRSAVGPAIPYRQVGCIMKWAKENRVEVKFTAWEFATP